MYKITMKDMLILMSTNSSAGEKEAVIDKIKKVNNYLSDCFDLFESYFSTVDLDEIEEKILNSNLVMPLEDEEHDR